MGVRGCCELNDRVTYSIIFHSWAHVLTCAQPTLYIQNIVSNCHCKRSCVLSCFCLILGFIFKFHIFSLFFKVWNRDEWINVAVWNSDEWINVADIVNKYQTLRINNNYSTFVISTTFISDRNLLRTGWLGEDIKKDFAKLTVRRLRAAC